MRHACAPTLSTSASPHLSTAFAAFTHEPASNPSGRPSSGCPPAASSPRGDGATRRMRSHHVHTFAWQGHACLLQRTERRVTEHPCVVCSSGGLSGLRGYQPRWRCRDVCAHPSAALRTAAGTCRPPTTEPLSASCCRPDSFGAPQDTWLHEILAPEWFPPAQTQHVGGAVARGRMDGIKRRHMWVPFPACWCHALNE